MTTTSWVHDQRAVWVYGGIYESIYGDSSRASRNLMVLEGPFIRRDEALSACRQLRREERGRRCPARRLVVLPVQWEV